MYKAVVFDMDGTILNTLEDLADSLNYVLNKTGHRHDFTAKDVRFFFGSGIRTAVRRELALEQSGSSRKADEALLVIGSNPDEPISAEESAELEKICSIFGEYYPQHCAEKTGPYPGVSELLQRLRAEGIATAVVSNKIDEAVGKLAEDYFPGLFDISVGEKEGMRRKPAPDMTDEVLKKLGVDRKEAVYIGDSEVDLRTAHNSGLDCISVDWGFRSRKYLESIGADVIASSTDEVFSLCRCRF